MTTVQAQATRVALYGDGELHSFDTGNMMDMNAGWADLPDGWFWFDLLDVSMVLPIAPRGYTEYIIGVGVNNLTVDSFSARALLDKWPHVWSVEATGYVADDSAYGACYGCATMRHSCTCGGN